MMRRHNLVLISLDEVRPDHLGCYGYSGITTPALDNIAREGVRFTSSFSTSDFTPVAMGSAITGTYPARHGMRNPYCSLTGPTIATVLKERGFATAGFVGNAILSEKSGFSRGFDHWNETSKETSWLELNYPDDRTEFFYEGNWWIDDFFSWLEAHYREQFFMWGHFYETHEGSENALLRRGLIKEGELAEHAYYDAKIKMADEVLIARLLETLDRLGIAENTTLVVMSDHGTNLGEHPVGQIPWRKAGKYYPQHTTMYDHDLHTFLLMKGERLPKGRVVEGTVSSVDLAPTLLELLDVPVDGLAFDGSSLLKAIETGRSERKELYAEDVFEARGKGALQAIRTEDIKYIRNLTLASEECYDLRKDPAEKDNILDTLDRERLIQLRKRLNEQLWNQVPSGERLAQEDIELINKRLRGLGYIE